MPIFEPIPTVKESNQFVVVMMACNDKLSTAILTTKSNAPTVLRILV